MRNYTFRGKGDNHRLGHTVEDHVRYPKQSEALSNKKVTDIAIGEFYNTNDISLHHILTWRYHFTVMIKG